MLPETNFTNKTMDNEEEVIRFENDSDFVNFLIPYVQDILANTEFRKELNLPPLMTS